MQLTSYTDYSLRVLIYLGLKGGVLSSITEIAQCYHISRNHLVKVVHRLAREGFVHSQRGRRGGISLARPPRAIHIGEVVRCTEGAMPLVECFRSATNQCPITPACRLSSVLAEARDHFLRTLDRYTLADLLVNQTSLIRLLAINVATNGQQYPAGRFPRSQNGKHPQQGRAQLRKRAGNEQNQLHSRR